MGIVIYIILQITLLIFAGYSIFNAKEISRHSEEQIRLTGKVESKTQRILMICAIPFMGFGYFVGIPLLSHQPLTSDKYIISLIFSVLFIGITLLRFRKQDQILEAAYTSTEMQANKTLQPTPSRDAPVSHDRTAPPKDLY